MGRPLLVSALPGISQIQDVAAQQNCALCVLILKGWRANHAQIIADALKSADLVNPNDPPADFARDILGIACFGPDEGATVSVALVSKRNEVDDGRIGGKGNGRGMRITALLRATCSPRMIRSWEANEKLVAEFRVSCGDSDRSRGGLEIDSVIPPDPMSRSSLGVRSAWLKNCIQTHGNSCGRQIRGEDPQNNGLACPAGYSMSKTQRLSTFGYATRYCLLKATHRLMSHYRTAG
ncbi:hypothetical protein F5Y16DRAFT_199024 [Xylariaceae sp. FL0255]|nr:hypothetical protein F5Y16DRAFT_199024 [Xylariaceae sp. FL0255]